MWWMCCPKWAGLIWPPCAALFWGLRPVADRIQPRGATIFRGAFDVAKASWFERWIMKKVNAAAGDFRDWQAIEAWAQGIAAVLQG